MPAVTQSTVSNFLLGILFLKFCLSILRNAVKASLRIVFPTGYYRSQTTFPGDLILEQGSEEQEVASYNGD
jgi:hypothetical protein